MKQKSLFIVIVFDSFILANKKEKAINQSSNRNWRLKRNLQKIFKETNLSSLKYMICSKTWGSLQVFLRFQIRISIHKDQESHKNNPLSSNEKDMQKGFKHILEKIQKLKETKYFRRQDLLRGGGNCCSNQNKYLDKSAIHQAFDEAKFIETENNHGIDENIQKAYNRVRKNTQFKQMEKTQENGEQFDEIKNILQNFLLKNKEKITTKVNTYRLYTIEMFNLCMSYNLSGLDCPSLVDSRQITYMLESLVSHFQKNLDLFPCLDLSYIFTFLQVLNQEEFDQRTKNYKQIEYISSFTKIEMVGKVMPLTHLKRIEEKSKIDGKQLLEKLKERAFNNQNQQFDNPWEIVQSIRDKLLFSKDIVIRQIGVIHIEKKESQQDELSFYINKFIELIEISQSPQLNYTITYLMVQISFILERNMVQDISQIGTQTPQLRSKIGDESYQKFIQILKQSFANTQQKQGFFKYSVQDIYFRFLSIKILLQLYVLNFQQDDLFVHLLFCYLTEKDSQIKIVFQSNKQFCYEIQKKLETKEKENLIQLVIQYQQDRLKNLESNKISKNEIQDIVDEIKGVEDFIYKISLNLIEKWELEARQRLEADIANKNDILLEVQDLQIDQNVQFLEGKYIFEEKDKLQNINAINLIREFFLIPKQKNSDQQCKILAILAQGGTGKSILIKKLETTLMRERSSSTQQDQQVTQKDNNKSSNQQEQIKLNEEDISNYQKNFNEIMQQCMKNSQLENLLILPINLYLFSRLIKGKSSSEIKEMIKNISDQIQIQDVFFQEQFQREAIDFINQFGLDIRNQQLRSEICSSQVIQFLTIVQARYSFSTRESPIQISKLEINRTFKIQNSKLCQHKNNYESQGCRNKQR
ncbi:hypothetical protein ABPG72_021779 [Tetrahymena utriculariae]